MGEGVTGDITRIIDTHIAQTGGTEHTESTARIRIKPDAGPFGIADRHIAGTGLGAHAVGVFIAAGIQRAGIVHTDIAKTTNIRGDRLVFSSGSDAAAITDRRRTIGGKCNQTIGRISQ